MPARSSLRLARCTILLCALAASTAVAQQPAADTMPGPKVGDTAPDFAVPAATRFGLLKAPIHLSDFRGVFGSDTGAVVGKLYGANTGTRKTDARFLYVIGPDGKITHTMKPFSVLNQE